MAAPAISDYRTLRVAPLTPTIGAELDGVRMSGDVSPERGASLE